MVSKTLAGWRGARMLVIALPLLVTLLCFVSLIKHQQETSNPAVAVQRMIGSGSLVPLEIWGFQFQVCPTPQADPKAANPQEACTYESMGQQDIRLPAPSQLSGMIKGQYRNSNMAVGEHIFSDDTRRWLESKKDRIVSFTIPHSVQNAVTVVIGRQRWTFYDSIVPVHVQMRASSLLANGAIRLEYDITNMPWFGPPELAPALAEPPQVAEYNSLRERQIGTANLANMIHIGFPLLVAAVAIVMDHSLAMFLLSLVGATHAARAFVSHLVNYQMLEGWLAKLLVLGTNGLAASCIILLALELASVRRVTTSLRLVVTAVVTSAALAMFFLDATVILKVDAIFDAAASVLAVLILMQGAWIVVLHRRNTDDSSALPSNAAVLATSLPLQLTKILVAAAGLAVHATVNINDLIKVQEVGFKDFLAWQHWILLPTLISACLIDVGSTSKKMFRFASEMVKKAMLERELELGREIQQKMLPAKRASAAGFSWRSIYLPASALAGDWYDIREIVFADGGKMLVACLADVTGHGAGAALSTGVISSQWGLWCQWAATQNTPRESNHCEAMLGDAPRQINEALLALRSNENCTAIFLMLDCSNQMITVCSAGHPGALIAGGSQLEYLTGRGDRLGASRPQEPWTGQSTHLKPGSLVVVFSDGVVPVGKTVSTWMAALARQLKRPGPRPLSLVLADQVRENRRSFRKSARTEDDITVLAIAYDEASQPKEDPVTATA
jgi:serine phosphatase RsbU (regulator of sigma subunit)